MFGFAEATQKTKKESNLMRFLSNKPDIRLKKAQSAAIPKKATKAAPTVKANTKAESKIVNDESNDDEEDVVSASENSEKANPKAEAKLKNNVSAAALTGGAKSENKVKKDEEEVDDDDDEEEGDDDEKDDGASASGQNDNVKSKIEASDSDASKSEATKVAADAKQDAPKEIEEDPEETKIYENVGAEYRSAAALTDEPTAMKVMRSNLNFLENNVSPEDSEKVKENISRFNQLGKQCRTASGAAKKIQAFLAAVKTYNAAETEFTLKNELASDVYDKVYLGEFQNCFLSWTQSVTDSTKNETIRKVIVDMKNNFDKKNATNEGEDWDLVRLIDFTGKKLEVAKLVSQKGSAVEKQIDSLSLRFKKSVSNFDKIKGNYANFPKICECIEDVKIVHNTVTLTALRFRLEKIPSKTIRILCFSLIGNFFNEMLSVLDEVQKAGFGDNEKEFAANVEKCIKTVNGLSEAYKKAANENIKPVKFLAAIGAFNKMVEQLKNRVYFSDEWAAVLPLVEKRLETKGIFDLIPKVAGTPDKAPNKVAVKAPAKAPVKAPVKAPAKAPVKAPAKVPAKAPAKPVEK
jgi:hypothetical protein